ncbi:unnamed protein product [Aphanomyces euteiches]
MVLAGQDAWRSHPFLTGCIKKPLPGLGIAAGIFSVYLVIDAIAGSSGSSHGHGGHHNGNSQYVKEEVGQRPRLEE